MLTFSRCEIGMKEVKDLKIEKETTFSELMKQFKEMGGFNAPLLAEASEILREMISLAKCLKFLSFPANIVATGLRGILKELVRRKMFDVVITTCGTVDHDLARSFKPYYQGTFFADDEKLREKGICRLGSVFVPDESYGVIIEEKMQEFLREIYEQGMRNISTYELCFELGRWIGKEDSILYWCWKNQVPVIIPSPTDGAVGYQLWSFSQEHRDFKIDVLKDEQLLNSLIWEAKSCGALVLGGGVSKHHVIWWAQFKGGLDYAVYITTAHEYDGSLSGARTREAVSWGKVKASGKHVTVEGDVTILLPLLYCYLLETLKI